VNLWQRSMIHLARSEQVKHLVQRPGRTPWLARRFVGGTDADAALTTAQRLRDDMDISSSLFYLGEYVDAPYLVEHNVEEMISAVRLLGARGLDVNMSADPTAIGYMAGQDLCRRNAERVAEAISAQPARARNCLMLDMEDLSLVAPTLALHQHLLKQGLPVAVTLQSRLRRTEDDLACLLGQPTAVRLVKGAFPLGPEHDLQGRPAITASYLALAKAMLSSQARHAGSYPVFATHDEVLARQLIDLARANGWSPAQYEFEMLYGVRPDWQQSLRTEGFSVRVYLPFGLDWWPYAARRVGENPRNLLLLGRALLGPKYEHVNRAAAS